MNIAELNNNITSIFPVVGIASAASEIEALQEIISNLPEDSGMAYIIIENLAMPQHEDLTDLLLDSAKLPVHEIVSTVELHPNNIYIIPQGNFLVWENETLQLKPSTRSTKPTNSLDLFFEALAEKYGSYAVGMLLSWSSLDGAAGLKKLKELGGAAVSAVNKAGFYHNDKIAEFIDYFTTAENAASQLLEIKNSYQTNHAYVEEDISQFDEKIFEDILEVISLRTQTNFHKYKPQTLRRRIAKRMVLTKQESAEKYLNLLKENKKEQDLLFNDFLISVTYFFRDPVFFESLQTNVFPALIDSIKGKELRIWSAGCSTGEEVYSLAICLDEYLQKTDNTDIAVKIFASDISEKCVEKARTGVYAAQDLKNVSEKRLSSYFTKRDSGYYINKAIRDTCIFAVHDLTKDFPFSKIDFIVCRNVLIYFNTELQGQVLSAFHYALRENGFLFLGKAETALTIPNLFTPVEKQEKIFMRQDAAVRLTPNLLLKEESKVKTAAPARSVEKDYRTITADIILENYSPAAVLVNEDLEIVHFHGDTSPFLQPPAGTPSFNVINMLHQEVRNELKNAIVKVQSEKKNIEVLNIAVKNQSFLTSFEVVYLPSYKDLLLVIFYRKSILDRTDNKKGESSGEFLSLQDDYRQLNEEQQIYFEELQTTNEELLRRTEELQLLNEQLETTAEELLSNNEELSCTNDELQNRRNELSSMRNFYESIVKTIREPLLIIDQNFIVRSANPAFYHYFRTQEEHTEGISIFELENSQWNSPEIKESILNKIRKKETVENVKIEFDLGQGRKKIMLVNTANILDSIPEGMILIALEDITDLEQSNEILKNKNAELENRTRQLESFTLAASHNLLEPIRKIHMFGKKIIDSDSSLPESVQHNVNRLLNTAVNMNQLIEDLINFSKINFAEKKFKKTDLNIVLKKALNDLKYIINERKAIISADPLPPMNIIPWQMHLLFTHLISNAIKYAKQDTQPQIKIELNFTDIEEINDIDMRPHTEYIKLSIIDNGIGFSKNFETLIFNPFYKLESNDMQYGTGLGLTLVQKIVWNHKGFIKASSSPGEGTAIYIFLPLENSLIENYSQN